MPYDGFIPIVYRELVKVNGRRIIILMRSSNIEKKTQTLNVITENIDPTLGNAKYYVYRELNCNDVYLEWDYERVIDNLRTITVLIYQELNTDIKGDPN